MMQNSSQQQSHRLGYLPGLDGFRGASLAAVLVFHGGFEWARGGFLGVTAFFVLSGFLITSLLLIERAGAGRIDLKAFWVRRAGRLVPAALLTFVLVAAYAAASDGSLASGIVGDAVAAAGWMANWRFVFEGQSYGDLFSDPSPLQHFWSLAVEEQFYLLLPPAAVLLLGRDKARLRRRRLAVAAAVVVLASTAAAALWHVIDGSTRAYYGTDTRVAEPLIGVLLALMLVSPAREGVRLLSVPRLVLDGAAVLAVAGLAVLMTSVDESSPLLYRGGFLLTAVLAAVVITAVTQPDTQAARVFSLPPLVAVGRISYGAYLFHWPVFLWLDADRTGLADVPLFAVRTALTLSLALVSYVLVEKPVRHGRLPRRVGALSWANATVGALAALFAVVSTAPASPASKFLSATGDVAPPPTWSTSTTAPADAAETAAPATTSAPTAAPAPRSPAPKPAGARPAARPGSPSQAPMATQFERSATPPPPPPTTTTTPEAPAPPPRLKVAVVGDSLADDLARGLGRWAAARGDVAVYNMSTPGCPISRGGTRRVNADGDAAVWPICSWWAEDDSELWKYFVTFDADLVVVHDGMNEVWDRKLPHWNDYRSAGDPRFDQWLLGEYRTAFSRFQSHGAMLLFLNTPCADWKRLEFHRYDDGVGDSRIDHLNDLAVTMQASGVWTADLYRHLCPNGKFTDTVDEVEDARPDGYHLTDEAEDAVANKWLGPLVASAMPPPPQGDGSR